MISNESTKCSPRFLHASLVGMLLGYGFKIIHVAIGNKKALFYLFYQPDTEQSLVLFLPTCDRDKSSIQGFQWSLRDALSAYKQIITKVEGEEGELARRLQDVPYFIPLMEVGAFGLTRRSRSHWMLLYCDGSDVTPLQLIDSKYNFGYDIGYIKRAVCGFTQNYELEKIHLGIQSVFGDFCSGQYVLQNLERVIIGENLANREKMDFFETKYLDYVDLSKQAKDRMFQDALVTNISNLHLPPKESFLVQHKFAIIVSALVALIVAVVLIAPRLAPSLLLPIFTIGGLGAWLGHGLLASFVGAGLSVGKASTAVVIVLPIIGGILLGGAKALYGTLHGSSRFLFNKYNYATKVVVRFPQRGESTWATRGPPKGYYVGVPIPPSDQKRLGVANSVFSKSVFSRGKKVQKSNQTSSTSIEGRRKHASRMGVGKK